MRNVVFLAAADVGDPIPTLVVTTCKYLALLTPLSMISDTFESRYDLMNCTLGKLLSADETVGLTEVVTSVLTSG